MKNSYSRTLDVCPPKRSSSCPQDTNWGGGYYILSPFPNSRFGMENETNIKGLLLEDYMAHVIKYNEKLEISNPDETLLYAPSEMDDSGDDNSGVDGEEDFIELDKYPALLSLSDSARTEETTVSLSLQNNYGEELMSNRSLPLLSDNDGISKTNRKLLGNGQNVDCFEVDLQGKTLLKRIETFLKKELAATKEKNDNQQLKDIDTRIINSGHSLLLTSNTKLNIYRQAFSMYIADKRQKKYFKVLTDISREYDKALRTAETFLQVIPELQSQIGSAELGTEMKLNELTNNHNFKLHNLTLEHDKQSSVLKKQVSKYAIENSELRRKLEYSESKVAIMSSQRKELLETHKVLLQYFKKYAQWRSEGRISPDGPQKPQRNVEEKETASNAADALAIKEWKGVHNSLAAIQKIHLRALSDVEALDGRHKTQMDALQKKIKELEKETYASAIPKQNKVNYVTEDAAAERPTPVSKSSPRVRIAKRVTKKASRNSTTPANVPEKSMLERLFDLRSPRPLPFEKIRIEEEKLRKSKSNIVDPLLRLHQSKILGRKKHLKPTRPKVKRGTVINNLPV